MTQKKIHKIMLNIKLVLIFSVVISSLFIILFVSYTFSDDVEHDIKTKQQDITQTIDSYVKHDVKEKSKLIDIKFIINTIHQHHNYNIALLVKEKNNNYTVQYATPSYLFNDVSIISQTNKRVTINDKTFSKFNYSLQDNSQLITLYDITTQLQQNRFKLYLLLLILTITSMTIIWFANSLKKRETLVKTINDKLYFNSRHHKLTKLPNIDVLFEDINLDNTNTILALNADNITLLNVTYGNNIVNTIIEETAKNLKHNSPSNAKLYHISIDEFIITLHNPSKDQETLLASQIKAYFEQLPIITTHSKTHINFSIGIAVHNKEDNHQLDIYEHANIALIEAKQRGKGLIVQYDPSMSEFGSYTQLASNISTLQNDLENGNLMPFYQPIVDTFTKEILKYEVLARMENVSGFISPDAFMKAAEVAGLQTVITKEIIQKSFKYFASSSTQFSINITKHDLLGEFLEEFLMLKTKTYNIEPKNITLEILESVIIDNDKIIKQINRLGSLGYIIAIDDFGIENSNISRLTTLNAQFLKIDGSFIKDMNTNEKHHYIAESLVYMAHKLGMKIIAEYVHNEEIYEHAKLLGIDYVQGYYFSEPKETI